MKKMAILVSVLFVFGLIASVANATPIAIKEPITIEADNNGNVTVTGTVLLPRLIQYCSDEVKDAQGCPNNVKVDRTAESTYPLSKKGLEAGQRVFNFQFASHDQWLRIPDNNVRLGRNLKFIPTREGYGIEYTGPAR